jgi:acyl-CoA thioesterase-1
VPFLLAGFALDPAAFQGDRIHPAAEQQERMMENVWVELKPLLR